MQITFSKAWQVPRCFCKKRRESIPSAIYIFVTVEAHISEWLARPLSLSSWHERDLFLFTGHQASDSDQEKGFTPGFQNIFQWSISFSMYSTLERLIRKVEYFSSLKEGYKMTILWLDRLWLQDDVLLLPIWMNKNSQWGLLKDLAKG